MNRMTTQQPLGVLGGLGPKTTAEFYERLVEEATTTERPAVCIWSLPLDVEKEAKFIARGDFRGYFLHQLRDGTGRLLRAGCRRIVIPCNTVHEFHRELSRRSPVPITNLIDVVADEVVSRGWDRVALLTTSRTRRTRLYQDALEARGISYVFPSQDEQTRLDDLIRGILGNVEAPCHQQLLCELIERTGETHVVLGCTDLRVPEEGIEVIDSMKLLASHTAISIRESKTLSE